MEETEKLWKTRNQGREQRQAMRLFGNGIRGSECNMKQLANHFEPWAHCRRSAVVNGMTDGPFASDDGSAEGGRQEL